MKRFELFFNLLAIPVDFIALMIAALIAYYLRNRVMVRDFVGPIQFTLDRYDYVTLALLAAAALLVIFALIGLYNQPATRRFLNELQRVIFGVTLGLFFVIIWFFFKPALFPSRFIILASWVLAIGTVIIGRTLLRLFQELLFAQGYGLHRLVLITSSSREALTLEHALKRGTYGYHIVETLPNTEKSIGEIEKLIEKKKIDEIIQADGSADEILSTKLWELARLHNLDFSYVPNLFAVQRSSIDIKTIQGVPLIAIKQTPLDGWGKIAKRIFDILVSLICILLTLPLFLLITLLVKLDSPGRALYAAPRVGRETLFRFYKFRTMYQHLSVGEEYGGKNAAVMRQQLKLKNKRDGENGVLFKIDNDPRVTRVGKFLRRSKLDELPQFWNVLGGQLSMVGPRPHLEEEVVKYRTMQPHLFSIKPGIFGLTQIAQIERPDLPFEEEVKLDTFYVENWSLLLDIKILIRSFLALFFSQKPKAHY